jgi:hypothetical protein
MEQETNEPLHHAIMQVVENQLRDRAHPEPKQTSDRVIAKGYEVAEAKRLIGCVVTSEIFNVLKKRAPFNPERYVQALNRLPKLPWE